MSGTDRWLPVLIFMGFAIAYTVAAIGILLPDLPVRKRLGAVLWLLGAIGCYAAAWHAGAR